jgi:spore coat polysaccharide biosynthesis protein SpsF
MIKAYFKKILRNQFLNIINSCPGVSRLEQDQIRQDYYDWLNFNLVNIANEFVEENNLLSSTYVRGINKVFKTTRFDLFLKRWIVEYALNLLNLLFENSFSKNKKKIILEENPLNDFIVTKFKERYEILPTILWRSNLSKVKSLLLTLISLFQVIRLSLNSGIRLNVKKKKFKVMREALWGFKKRGIFFHDNFLVDNDVIKDNDVLFFSRDAIYADNIRMDAFNEFRESKFAHFYLPKLRIGIKELFSRVLPKYSVITPLLLLNEIFSKNFSFYHAILHCFNFCALPYEKIFSNYRVNSELGHNMFSFSYIPESIVCQNYGTKYYFFNLSDYSLDFEKYIFSFLSCDNYLIWGKAHFQKIEGDEKIIKIIGYPFKKMIFFVKENKSKILSEMGIVKLGKIVSFFDESFGLTHKSSDDDFVNMWEAMLKMADLDRKNTYVMKPKVFYRFKRLSENIKNKFISILDKLKSLNNVYILDSDKWSFIEAIGVSDVVVSQGMTSSSTIALICGIEGIYFNQAHYKHPFVTQFSGKIVFDKFNDLKFEILELVNEKKSVFDIIGINILREYDAFSDNNGLERLREVLIFGDVKEKSKTPGKRIGIIVQARMGSTRLPGKIIKEILGKPMLSILIERLKKVKLINDIIIATTTQNRDDIIVDIAKKCNVKFYRGEEEDVLKRYYDAARENKLDVVVRVTSDCPIADPEMIDKMIQKFLSTNDFDYLSNTLVRTYPRGFDAEVFNFTALDRAFHYADRIYQREHVTPFIHEHMRCYSYENDKNYSNFRVTVDTIEDFELVSEIFNQLKQLSCIKYQDVINLLNSSPELAAINQDVKQKEVTT